MSGIAKSFGKEAYQIIILWLLKDQAGYGYDIADRFETLTNGHISISFGTIYPMLRRLQKQGLVSSKKDESSRRVYYTLMPKGEAILKQFLERSSDYRKFFDRKIRGILALYVQLFGHEALTDVLQESLN